MILRIGNEGSLLDNAHAGGLFCSVNKKGLLGKQLFNQHGRSFTEINGIDFSKGDYIVPNMDEVLSFACRVGDSIPHLRLLALDIMLDENCNPILIEFNNNGFAPWLYQMTGQTALGDYTQEIIEYCVEHKHKSSRIYVCM